MFDANAKKDPQKVILYFEDERWTNEQVKIIQKRLFFILWAGIQFENTMH